MLRYSLWVCLAVIVGLGTAPASAQEVMQAGNGVDRPNYRLAGRFAPYKISELIHGTSLAPRWIEDGPRFWYEWETSDGRTFNLVDPAAGTKREIFDNDRIASELTRITKDPYDGQHLPIQQIRFIDDNTIQFDVTSSGGGGGGPTAGAAPYPETEDNPPLRVRREHPDAPGAGRLRSPG
jgi:hypothetical protein